MVNFKLTHTSKFDLPLFVVFQDYNESNIPVSATVICIKLYVCLISCIDDDEDDEPLLSGSGAVQKDCTEEELGSWSDLLNKWKDITIKPKQLQGLVRKVG